MGDVIRRGFTDIRLRRWFVLVRKMQYLEDISPPSKPMTRVWLMFRARKAAHAIAAVGLLAREGSVHPEHPEAKAGQPYIDVQFGKQAWRVHVDYSDG